ncbi:MAG TPA: hypothetical protein ENI23_02515 [bacterium]|nr:hypothetical protein [bacterium]
MISYSPTQNKLTKILSYLLPIVAVGLLFYITFNSVELGEFGGDDLYFNERASEEPSLTEFVEYRYLTWSSRLGAEYVMLYIMKSVFFIWPLLSTIISISVPLLLIRLATGKHFFQIRPRYIWLALCLFGFIPIGVMKSAHFWISGSFNYLYAVPIGLIAMIPFRDLLFDETKKFYPISILSSALIFIFNEQIGVSVLAFALLVLTYKIGAQILSKENFKPGKEIKKYAHHLLLTVLLLIGIIFVAKAPGNSQRLIGEINTWYPNFGELSLFSKVVRGIKWIFWGLTVNYWWSWSSIIAMYLATIKTKITTEKFFYVFIVLSALASQALMFFSPTIYASGDRVYYIYFVLIGIIPIAILSQSKGAFAKRLTYLVIFTGIFLLLANSYTIILNR